MRAPLRAVGRLLRSEIAVVGLGQMLQQVLSLATGIAIARMLESSGYGVVNLLRNVFTALVLLAPLGLDLALLKFVGQHGHAPAQSLGTIGRLRAIALAVNVGVALLIGLGLGSAVERYLYPYPGFASLFTVTLLALPFAADLAILGACYKAWERPGLFALMTLYLQPVLRVALVAGAWLLSPTVLAIALINSVQVIASSITAAIHFRTWRQRLQTQADVMSDPADAPAEAPASEPSVTQVLGDSLWMAVGLFVYGMMRFADVLILGAFATAKEVGEYGALSTVSQIVQVYPLAASQSLGSRVSRYYHAGDMAGVRRLYEDYMGMASLVSSFLFAGIAAFGTRLDLVFGPSFHFASATCILMPLGYLVSATLAPTGYTLSMTGRHRPELAILALGGATLVALCVLLVPSYGQVGAAAAVLSAFLVINVTRFGLVARTLGFVPGRVSDLLPPVLALAAAFAARELTDLAGQRTLLMMFCGCLVYALLFALLAVLFCRRALAGLTRKAPGREM